MHRDPPRGWDVDSVVAAQAQRWPTFVERLVGHAPLSSPPDAIDPAVVDINYHNSVMVLAYALALTARGKTSISMLDWGGGIGHSWKIASALLDDVSIEYHCKDLSRLVEYGRALAPSAHFYADDAYQERSYDFVLASSALQYSPTWQSTFRGLAEVTDGYMLLTAIPIVHESPSFVFLQRPHHYGYNTEYLAWCLNRDEVLTEAAAAHLLVVREFELGYEPPIAGAPEQCRYRAFLFRPEEGRDQP